MNIAAFFDIDGTFYRDSLLIEHFKRLTKYEIISPSVWHEMVKPSFNNWDKRQGDYDEYLKGLSELYREHLVGLSKEAIEFTANQVMNLKADRVYRYTRQQIKWHLEQGHKVIFISGSPDFLVSKMANKYKADDYCGSAYHIDDTNTFNGEITPMWDSASKEKQLNTMLEKHNIVPLKSYAYGDTNGDVTMLRYVGNPVAINPAKELLNAIYGDSSLKNKTKVVLERKDVIYEIDTNTNELKFL